MSTPAEDPLYEVFEQHLHSGLYDNQPVEKFVSDVVDFFYASLKSRGHIPEHMRELVRVNLSQDVQDMLRAKIYGHYGIAEYNRVRRAKSP